LDKESPTSDLTELKLSTKHHNLWKCCFRRKKSFRLVCEIPSSEVNLMLPANLFNETAVVP